MNQWNGIGNLGADPVVHRTDSGHTVTTINIAVDGFYYRTLADGTRKKEKTTQWIPIVVWGKDAELAERYLQKGSKISVTGELRSRVWNKQDGSRVTVLEVHSSKINWLSGIKSINQS